MMWAHLCYSLKVLKNQGKGHLIRIVLAESRVRDHAKHLKHALKFTASFAAAPCGITILPSSLHFGSLIFLFSNLIQEFRFNYFNKK